MNDKELQSTNPPSVLNTLLVRVVILLILASSVGLVLRSVNRLRSVNAQLKLESLAVSSLGNEVQQLEQGWNPVKSAQTEEQFKAANEALFGGTEEMVTWQSRLPEEALASSISAIVQPSQSQPYPAAEMKLSVLPVKIELQPVLESQRTNISYQQLLTFAELFQKSNRRIDLVELHVLGNSNSVRQATALVRLWGREGKP